LLTLVHPAAAQGNRPAEKGAVGTTVHFTLEGKESKDIAISLPKGDYVIQADLKLVEEKSTNVQMQVDLLKTNGVLVENRILSANEIHRVARIANTFHLAKPLGARLRVTNENVPMEMWITVIPTARRTFLPFPYYEGEIQPLGIGEANGKGGTLAKSAEDGFYAFHKVSLPPGKYDVSLYLKQTDGGSSNLMGSLVLLDKFGVPDKQNWKLNVNEIDKETRSDKRLVVIKPATYYFLVTNSDGSKVYDYTVGIEKATD
jgi:hypothetical protein